MFFAETWQISNARVTNTWKVGSQVKWLVGECSASCRHIYLCEWVHNRVSNRQLLSVIDTYTNTSHAIGCHAMHLDTNAKVQNDTCTFKLEADRTTVTCINAMHIHVQYNNYRTQNTIDTSTYRPLSMTAAAVNGVRRTTDN